MTEIILTSALIGLITFIISLVIYTSIYAYTTIKDFPVTKEEILERLEKTKKRDSYKNLIYFPISLFLTVMFFLPSDPSITVIYLAAGTFLPKAYSYITVKLLSFFHKIMLKTIAKAAMKKMEQKIKEGKTDEVQNVLETLLNKNKIKPQKIEQFPFEFDLDPNNKKTDEEKIH